MTLTREQAEAAGWRTYKAPDLVGAVYFAEADCSRYRILASGLSDDAANASVLAAIAAIESYPACVEMLEEAKRSILNLVENCGAMSSDGDKAINDAVDLLAKLEAMP